VPGTDGRVLAVGDLCVHPAQLMQTAHMAKWAARGAATTVALANGRSTLQWNSWPAYLWGPAQRWPPVYCVSLGRHAAVVVVNKTALPQIVGRASGGVMKMAIEVRQDSVFTCVQMLRFIFRHPAAWYFFFLVPIYRLQSSAPIPPPILSLPDTATFRLRHQRLPVCAHSLGRLEQLHVGSGPDWYFVGGGPPG
jgi:hypothetical protein